MSLPPAASSPNSLSASGNPPLTRRIPDDVPGRPIRDPSGISMSAGVRARATPVAASSAAAARLVGELAAGAGVRFTAPRGQPSPGGVVTAQTQQAADDLQAVAPGQPVLGDVPATPARLHRPAACDRARSGHSAACPRDAGRVLGLSRPAAHSATGLAAGSAAGTTALLVALLKNNSSLNHLPVAISMVNI